MRSSGDTGSTTGNPDRFQALDPQRHPGGGQKILHIVGIGPGNPEHLSLRAREVLSGAEAVVGYTTYIDLIRPLIGEKKIVSTPMTQEVERVACAIDLARGGTRCALVSSGDPGIYAMAGLVFEICEKQNIAVTPHAPAAGSQKDPKTDCLEVEVVPGIPALCAGASLLGAPLTHDFAAISLSDLLTPWEVIERRIEAAAQADFVIVIYNPKSKKRHEQLEKAQQIMLRHRDGKTPVGIVTSAMREGQDVRIVTLEDLHTAPVNMQSTVFVGSSASFRYLDFMVTPRGYGRKYELKNGKMPEIGKLKNA